MVRGVTRTACYDRPALHNGHSVGAWRSLVARIVRDDEVGGSNPLAPTNRISTLNLNSPTRRPSSRSVASLLGVSHGAGRPDAARTERPFGAVRPGGCLSYDK